MLTRLGIPRRTEDYLRADASTDLLGDVVPQREDARQGAFERFAPKLCILVGTGELRERGHASRGFGYHDELACYDPEFTDR